ncbi:hypothetical protein TcBrA4_0032770 [Trypanosoma cruzi]|nr:hypothetical protein TcBrA4_0032770 [Trypanosoma cruzi]
MVLHSADRFRAAAAPHVVVAESETLLSMYVCVFNTGPNNLNYPCLEEFASSCPQWCCTRRIVFEAAAAPTLWSMFLFRIMNGGSQRHSLSMYVCVFTTGHQHPELSLLGGISELCPQWCCTRRIVFERLCTNVVVYVFVSNYEWRESEDTLFQCMFACSHTGHQTTLNYPLLGGISRALPTMVLHSADRFRAAAAPTLWSMFLFRIMNGGSQRHSLSMYVCVFNTGHQTTLNYPLLGGISRAPAHNGAALGGSFSSGCCTTRCGLCFCFEL